MQASIRRLNQPKMKDIKRQIANEEELKRIELEKDKANRDEAAKKLQASIKRLKQPKIKDIKKAKEIIGGRVKT